MYTMLPNHRRLIPLSASLAFVANEFGIARVQRPHSGYLRGGPLEIRREWSVFAPEDSGLP